MLSVMQYIPAVMAQCLFISKHTEIKKTLIAYRIVTSDIIFQFWDIFDK